MQNWEKLGLVFQNQITGYTHAALPIVIPSEKSGIFNVIFSARNNSNQSVPFKFSFDLARRRILNVSDVPLLIPGNAGTFDSDGVMPTCLIAEGGILHMFYIGWNRASDVPFRNSLGLAISKDQGQSFHKVYEGPILDRSIYDPCFVASCDILKEEDDFKMWYLSAIKWEKNGDHWKHFYHIKTAVSTNLRTWERTGNVAINFSNASEYAISTPRVLRSGSTYRMWYSHRGSHSPNYQIGYAESSNGATWDRKDNLINLPLGQDWDSEMTCYPFLFHYDNDLYMLYNGNGYGKSGIGLAICKDE